MTGRNRLAAVLIPALSLIWVGCGPASEAGSEPAAPIATETPVDIELANLMGDMQRHGDKLGYAIAGRNRPLAAFYLEEVAEVLAELMTVEADDGMPIAHPARVILAPALESLKANLETEEPWPEVTAQYELVIAACNRCHLATEHGFIEILPATGPPPFNQRFDAKDG